MAIRRPCLALLLAIFALASATSRGADEIDAARARWEASPYGPMLERILPPGFTPQMLPERGSPGAKLVLRYCVQCHNLPNPAMHQREKWPKVVERMAERMRGRGNLGKLMSEMMGGVLAPSAAEEKILVAYLGRNAQRALDPKRFPEVLRPSGEAFRLACQQCHVLPDPRRHTAAEWPAVVARMERNMQWMNRVVGSQPVRGEPQLRVEDINAFLARHARRAPR